MKSDDQTYMSSVAESARFFYYRGRGHFLKFLRNRIRWHIYPRLGFLTPFPDHVDIEASSACNMRCPMCYTITDIFKENVKLTVMDFDLFKKIVDECTLHNCFSIRLSWRGEPTLNPRFIDMVRYAKAKGIKEVSSLTNLLKLTPAMFEQLVEAQMDWLTISFDGMGETYNAIRAPAKFDDAVAKIREFSAIKKRMNSIKPVIRIQGVWPAIKENPQAFFDTFHGFVDQIAINPLLDYLRKDSEITYLENFDCPVLWQRFTVGADGLVSLCVHDELSHHIIGDLKKDTVREIWNGPALRDAREAHRRHIGVSKYKACAQCFLPRARNLVQAELDGRKVAIEYMQNRPDEVGR